MSYEGYEELICINGHLWVVDAMSLRHADDNGQEKQMTCPYCNNRAVFQCSVDETNGIDSSIPETMPGPKDMFAFEEIECTDFKGNKYFIKRDLFAPNLVSKRWSVTESEGGINVGI